MTKCEHCHGRGYVPGDPEGSPIEGCDWCTGTGRDMTAPIEYDGLRAILARAVDICRSYAEFISRVPASQLEEHPYPPEIEAIIEDADAALRSSPAVDGVGEPVAWEGYWPGAGSVNSETTLTKHKSTAERWVKDGAEVTPLYALSPRSS